jgi:hypothetical protein
MTFARHEAQLAEERQAALRLLGENGAMRRRFDVLQERIAEHQAEAQALLRRQEQLREARLSLLVLVITVSLQEMQSR